jgi:hypothetical protein
MSARAKFYLKLGFVFAFAGLILHSEFKDWDPASLPAPWGTFVK